MRSAICNTSSSRCDTYSTDVPRWRSAFTTASSCCASRLVSAAVGSSRISNSGARIVQRTNASWVRCVADSSATSASSGSTTPSASQAARAWRRMASRAISGVKRRVGKRAPMNRLSSAVTLAINCGSWCTTATPLRAASFGDAKVSASPRQRNCPASAAKTPLITLMRVDLPAPFSPISACTSPARTSSDTSVSAATPAKDLDTPLTSS